MADDLGDNWWETDNTADDGDKSNKVKGKAKVSKKGAATKSPSFDNTEKKSLKRKKEVSAGDLNPVKRKKTVGNESAGLDSSSSKVKGKENRKKKKQKKPKQAKAKTTESESALDDEDSKAKKPAKKKERKRISQVPDDELSLPGTAEDLRTMMSKQLKDRLGEAALEDVLPNADTDFFTDNESSLEPSDYLKTILPSWREVTKKSLFMKNMGSPSLLIITSSAIRAVELIRDIKDFVTPKCKVAKLFAKHMKLEEQKKFLAKTNIQVGVGTPARISQLIKQGGLQLESLVGVVFDWNWRDQKLKRMADIPEVRAELVALIKDFLLETVQGSSCKFGLL